LLYISKAALDSVLGANFALQDLSPVIGLLTTRPRPVTQFAPMVPATNLIHQWIEQGRNLPFTGQASYAQGALPNTQAKAPVLPQNVTCRSGETAQVTDEEMAVFNGAGTRRLAEGEEARLLQDALDLETELTTLDVLDEMEMMHIIGNSANTQAFAGGQTTGLVTWITASGIVVATGGTTSTPVSFTENFIKDAARTSMLQYPGVIADTLLVPPEIVPDINATVGGGSNRPITQIVNAGPNGTAELTGGNQVSFYQTGFSVLTVRVEPALSPAYNTALPQPAIIGYNSSQVKHAELIKLHAEPLARTDTSVKKMVTSTYAQEHRIPQHAFLIPNVKSAIS
jgi:hypothetical protein